MKPETVHTDTDNGYGGNDWVMDTEAIRILHEIYETTKKLELNQVAMQKDIQVLQTHNTDCMQHCLPVFKDCIEKLLDERQEKADAKQEIKDEKYASWKSVVDKTLWTISIYTVFLSTTVTGVCVWLANSGVAMQLLKVLHDNILMMK